MRGSLSGSQTLEYNGAKAYSINDGDAVSAGNYQPILIAKIKGEYTRRRIKYFQVRTRSTVNMTANMRRTMAVMGGAGALYSALVRNKAANIYTDCVRVCPKDRSLRSFIFPLLCGGLSDKSSVIQIADGVSITNPWIYSGTQTLDLDPSIISKFNAILSN